MPDQTPYHGADFDSFSIAELERADESGSLTPEQRREVRRILRQRRAEPDRNLQRWILAVAIAALVIGLLNLIWALAH